MDHCTSFFKQPLSTTVDTIIWTFNITPASQLTSTKFGSISGKIYLRKRVSSPNLRLRDSGKRHTSVHHVASLRKIVSHPSSSRNFPFIKIVIQTSFCSSQVRYARLTASIRAPNRASSSAEQRWRESIPGMRYEVPLIPPLGPKRQLPSHHSLTAEGRSLPWSPSIKQKP